MIDPKDRSQLLRMAGNIACGITSLDERIWSESDQTAIAVASAKIAFKTMREVDKLIAEEATDD